MDHMRNCIKGAKNSIPLHYLLLGTEWKTKLKNSWNKSSDQRQSLQINTRKTMKDNEQTRRSRWVRECALPYPSVLPLLLWSSSSGYTEHEAVLGTPNWLLLFFNMEFSILSKKLFFFQKIFNTKDYKFPQYDWYSYLPFISLRDS